MANWYVTPNGAGSNSGVDWANAWNQNSIGWGSMGAGDTLYLSGGTSKAVYGPLDVGRGDITIARSEDAGHNGYVVIFGGRQNHLPASHIPTSQYSSDGVALDESGIHLNAHENIVIDGGIWQGITVHGFNRDGMVGWSTNPGGHTVRDFDAYDNGTFVTDNGKYRGDTGKAGAGIKMTGDGWTIERVWLHLNEQDGIQSVGGQRSDNWILQDFLFTNEITHYSQPLFPHNYLEHNDGVQMFTGCQGATIRRGVGMHLWHMFILGDSAGAANNNLIEDICAINVANVVRWHGNAPGGNNNNTVRRIVAKKWWQYFDDNGIGHQGGEIYYLKGTGNVHEDCFWGGKGSFTLASPAGSQTFTNQYHDGTLTGQIGQIGATQVDPQFANPGPDGIGSDDITAGWMDRDLTIGNGAVSIAQTYTGPLDFIRQMTGIHYFSVPKSIHATYVNQPRLRSLPQQNVGTGLNLSYQIDAWHPDGGVIGYAVSGFPGGSISSSGLLTANGLADGTYTPIITLSSGSETISARLTVVVGGGSGGGADPILQNPGGRVNVVNEPLTVQLIGSDPNGTGVTFGAIDLPNGLTINTNTGLISGSPLTTGVFNVTVSATNSVSTVNQNFAWTINSAGNGQGATVLHNLAAQRLTLASVIDLQIAFSDALSLAASVVGLPPGMSLEIVQPVEVEIPAGGNSPPVLTNPGNQTATVGDAISLQLSASDADSDPLTWSEVNLPSGLTLSSSGLISGTVDTVESPTVTVTVDDGNGGSDDVAFSFTVSAVPNNAPVLTNPGNQTATVGDVISLQLSASDADSDPLTWSEVNLPSGLSLSSSGLISGTVDTVEAPSVTVTVDDGNGGTDDAVFSFTVSAAANNAPVLTNPGNQTATVGDVISLQLSASDADSDPLTWSEVNLPSGLTLSSSGLISGTVDTVEAPSVTVTVDDGNGGTDDVVFSFTVSAASNPAVTLDSESDGNNGQGGSQVGSTVVHTWDIGTANGSTFTITRTIASHPTLNGGSGPTFATNQLFSHDRINVNASGGTTYHLITLDFSQPIDSCQFKALAINSAQGQGVQDISNGGTAHNIANDANGYIEWLGLGGVSSVTFVVSGNSGIYAGSPKGDLIVSAS